jgi:hypothetical protein
MTKLLLQPEQRVLAVIRTPKYCLTPGLKPREFAAKLVSFADLNRPWITMTGVGFIKTPPKIDECG